MKLDDRFRIQFSIEVLEKKFRVNSFKAIILCLSVVAGASNQLKVHQNEDVIGNAISDVVKSVFVEKSLLFDIISSNENGKDFDAIITSCTQKHPEALHKIVKVNYNEIKLTYEIHNSAIFLIDSFEDVQNFESKFRLSRVATSHPLHLLIYCPNASEKLIRNYLQKTLIKKNLIVQFQTFLVEENGSLSLKAVRLFSPGKCRTAQLISINTFSKKSMKWKTRELFAAPPVKNFDGCSIFFGSLKNHSLDLRTQILDHKGQKQYKQKYYTVDMIDTIAKHLNFSAVYVFPKLSETDPTSLAEISSMQFAIDAVNQNVSFATYPFEYEAIKFLVPPGEAYTSFEKLFMAFEVEVWIWILITFAIAFVTIFIIYLMPKTIQDIVFGSRVTTPSLNVTGAFFGISQTIIPQRSFARFLLMSFILFSLIIRTAYQGRSFEILQKEIVKKGLQTVEEMFEKNFTVFIARAYSINFGGTELVKR